MTEPARRRRGFTLIEVLIVATIIGVLAVMALGNFRSVMNRARQKRTMSDMRTLALGIDSFGTDRNAFPASAGFALPSGLSLPTATIGDVISEISPTYLRAAPLVDGWNSWFTYGTDSSRANYVLRSNGSDGIPETSPLYGITNVFEADIILVNGSFVQFPEGVQK